MAGRAAPDAATALGRVLDDALAGLTRPAALLAGDHPADAAEALHQCRVAIRRLRSALRAFAGWVEPPPDELVAGLRGLFETLGVRRDRDVLVDGIAAELARAGAPPLPLPAAASASDPAALMRAEATQALLQGWARWRAGLAPTAAGSDEFPRRARRRLRRWQRRLAAQARAFDTLDAAARHALRKRVKRQRYALEGLAPLLPRRRAARHLRALAEAQRALGEVCDLGLAREAYRACIAQEPAAWFAVGWLTARLAQAQAEARVALGRVAALKPLAR